MSELVNFQIVSQLKINIGDTLKLNYDTHALPSVFSSFTEIIPKGSQGFVHELIEITVDEISYYNVYFDKINKTFCLDATMFFIGCNKSRILLLETFKEPLIKY